MTELVTYGSVGGVGSNPGPYPAHGLRDYVQIRVGDYWHGAGDGASFGEYQITPMKYLLASTDLARVGLAQSLLDVAGIEWELRNQAVSQAEVGTPFATELWVLHDKDYESARELIKSGTAPGWFMHPTPNQPTGESCHWPTPYGSA